MLSLKGLVRIDDFVLETKPVIHLREIYDINDLELSKLTADIYQKGNNGIFKDKDILKIKLFLHVLCNIPLKNESIGMELISQIKKCLENKNVFLII